MKQPPSFSKAAHLLRKGIGLSVLTLSLLASLVVVPVTVRVTAAGTTQCNRYVLPVHLTILDLTTYHVVSWLCYGQTPGSTVQLLVHGATYGHTYWDFSCPACQSDTYSYVKYMAQAGYTTFTYDRLGNGQSDHPLSELVTIQTDAYVLSQLLSDLKMGTYGGAAFKKVILVGHSVGSAISIAEAANPTFARPDGVILSGFLHFVDPLEVALLATEVYPARVDPDPRFHDLLPGYITTIPNTRSQIFYYLADVDPNIIAADEATKETITDSELASFFTIEATTVSRAIHVPVLEALGQFDNLFCRGTFDCTNDSTVQTYEAAFFCPDAHLQVVIIPQAGHDLNLQQNATTDWYPQAVQWLQAHV